jgi:hypothetical protein
MSSRFSYGLGRVKRARRHGIATVERARRDCVTTVKSSRWHFVAAEEDARGHRIGPIEVVLGVHIICGLVVLTWQSLVKGSRATTRHLPSGRITSSQSLVLALDDDPHLWRPENPVPEAQHSAVHQRTNEMAHRPALEGTLNDGAQDSDQGAERRNLAEQDEANRRCHEFD